MILFVRLTDAWKKCQMVLHAISHFVEGTIKQIHQTSEPINLHLPLLYLYLCGENYPNLKRGFNTLLYKK